MLAFPHSWIFFVDLPAFFFPRPITPCISLGVVFAVIFSGGREDVDLLFFISFAGRSGHASIGGRLAGGRHATSGGGARPGAAHGFHVGLGRAPGPEADARRASLPLDPAHVSRHGRQDHGHAARNRQLGAAPHARTPRGPQG